MRKERIKMKNRPVKSKFLLKLTYLEDRDGELIPVSSHRVMLSGREFMEDMNEDKKNGINHRIEIVNEEPKDNIELGVIYILATRDKAWVWNLNT